MDNDKFIYFVLLQSDTGKMNSGFGFRTYDDEEGNVMEYHDGKLGKDKLPEPTKFQFSRRHRTMPVHKKASGKDKNGDTILRVDFLRNHPQCEGSPNARGATPKFKEMNSDKDIDIALEANKVRREAEELAANLTGEGLKNAAAMYGKIDGSAKAKKFVVMQAAFHDPEKFLATVNNEEFTIRGFIQRAIMLEVLNRVGYIIKFENVTIGIDEEEAIHTLLKDKDLFNSINKLVKNKK